MRLTHTAAELAQVRGTTGPCAVVMTMGALHEGHAELIRRARAEVGPAGWVVVTDFVNPTQFGPNEDFGRYPRTLEHDLEVCEQAGADVVLAPSVSYMYGARDEHSVSLDPGALATILEGAVRPGHFAGVLTVVAKLLHLTVPDVALFGEKDYQQLALIRRMVDDLSFGVRIVAVPTVREPDGLAMSSRNRYLSDDERALAAAVPASLQTATRVAAVDGAAAGVAAGLAVLDRPGISVDYLTITDPTLGPVAAGPARALVAVRIGSTRLIDNMACEVARP